MEKIENSRATAVVSFTSDEYILRDGDKMYTTTVLTQYTELFY